MGDETPDIPRSVARQFPTLWTPAQFRKHFRGRPFSVCTVCHLAVDCRNSRRHRKACARRKRLYPEAFEAWKKDMRS